MEDFEGEKESSEDVQSLTPSGAFIHLLTSEVNKEDIQNMVEIQNHMLQRYEKTNEMLLNFNGLSTARYDATCKEFKQHTQLLTDMKKDLDSIFKRIRTLKTKLSKNYPEAFLGKKNMPVSDVYNVLNEEEEEMEEEEEPEPTTPKIKIEQTFEKDSNG